MHSDVAEASTADPGPSGSPSSGADPDPVDRPTVAAEGADPTEGSDLTEQGRSAPTDRPWRRSLRAAAAVWLITHVGYVLLTFAAFFQSNRPVPTSLGQAFSNWGNWDAQWFAWIAEHGYTGYTGKAIDDERSAAFFPLYSILIKLLSYLVVQPVLAAVLIAFAAQVAAFTILHRLTESELDSPAAARVTWLMVAFPTGFYLGITYNASLYLLLAVGSIYLMRRAVWWGAALLGALAGATRSSALLLIAVFAFEYLRQHGFSWRRFPWRRIRLGAAWIALMPAGLGSYVLFCWYTFGDPVKFSTAQALWLREPHPPWTGMVETVRVFASTRNIFGNDVRNLVDLGCVLVVGTLLTLALVGPWKLRRDQWVFPVFGWLALIYIMSFPSFDEINRVPLLSAGRLSLEAFPAFMIAARIAARNPTFERAFLFIGVLIQGLWFTHFLLEHFIG